MSKVYIDREKLVQLRDWIDGLLAQGDGSAPPEPPEPPSGPDNEDWRCYIDRYRDIKLRVENLKPHLKKAFAETHWVRFGENEGRIWGCQSPPPNAPGNVPDIRSAPAGMLWKPVSESRGGVPVLLTPKGWAKTTVRLLRPNGEEIPVQDVFARGLTNGDRQTYFFMGAVSSALPLNLVVDTGRYGKWLVADPTMRYQA